MHKTKPLSVLVEVCLRFMYKLKQWKILNTIYSVTDFKHIYTESHKLNIFINIQNVWTMSMGENIPS